MPPLRTTYERSTMKLDYMHGWALAMAAWFLVWLTAVVTIIVVAAHFIIKYW